MSDQTSETTPTTGHSSTHTWPWRTEEFVSMALVSVVALAVGYLTHNLIGLAVGVLVAIVGPLWLWRTKVVRVTKSAVTITINGDRVTSSSKGPLGKSAVDLSEVRSVAYRKYGSDETFMISAPDKGVKIPLRATEDPEVRAVVEQAFANATETTSEARELRSRMPAAREPRTLT